MKISILIAFLLTAVLTSCQPTSTGSVPSQGQKASQESGVKKVAEGQIERTPDMVRSASTATNINTATVASTVTIVTPKLIATTPAPTVTVYISPTSTPTHTPTMEPTPSITPTATIEPTATYWPTVTRQVLPANVAAGLLPCEKRVVASDLLNIVTQQFALPEYYVPSDLTSLGDHFSSSVTRNQELYARAVIIEPLQRMINEMHAAGLQPSILSAYRSYNEQALAWHWWSGKYPGRVAIMSAQPGRSEHQLGTTIDFGSPELDHLFHVDFADTAEGIWLANNAHTYGFTLGFPSNSYTITGFKHEPWHFRYVGTDLAGQLHNSGQILTQWQLASQPPPCIP